MQTLLKRPRRNRKSDAIRSLVAEHLLTISDCVVPLFIREGEMLKEEISSLPFCYRFSLDELMKEVDFLFSHGIRAIALFPVISTALKDSQGSYALKEDNLVVSALKLLKREFPSLCLITDIALDPYTDHGHDGVLNERQEVDNDKTVEILSKMALLHAEAGADIVAPSDMMDGRVLSIRRRLDFSGFTDVAILSYAAKYASSLYAPFRGALGSHLAFGDKKGYQMNPANSREALLEAQLDEEEGADILLVKPALFYLDIIAKIKEKSLLPIAAYHVSGEYAMVMAAEKAGFLDATKVFYEALLSIKRSGASLIFSYAIQILLRRDPLLIKR